MTGEERGVEHGENRTGLWVLSGWGRGESLVGDEEWNSGGQGESRIAGEDESMGDGQGDTPTEEEDDDGSWKEGEIWVGEDERTRTGLGVRRAGEMEEGEEEGFWGEGERRVSEVEEGRRGQGESLVGGWVETYWRHRVRFVGEEE